MKKIINYFLYVLTAGGLSHYASAQDVASKKNQPISNERVTGDSTRNQRMESDLKKRNSLTNNDRITWKESMYGYDGTYSANNVQYMALYDKDGKYVETLTKKEWNDNAPEKLRSSYGQSDYKSQKVTGYWIVTDPNRKGYYLELTDDQNRISKVWANEEGKFSNSPTVAKKDY